MKRYVPEKKDGEVFRQMCVTRLGMDNVKCMNPWDPQSKRQYQIDGAYCTLDAGNAGGGQAHGICYAIEGNGARPSHQGNGFSDDGRMYTLNTIEKHAVCYRISSYASNAMLSDNPHSGISETEVSRTLDLNCCNPACNQGGVIVVYEGQNCLTDTKKSFTLLAGRPDDHHIPNVCYRKDT